MCLLNKITGEKMKIIKNNLNKVKDMGKRMINKIKGLQKRTKIVLVSSFSVVLIIGGMATFILVGNYQTYVQLYNEASEYPEIQAEYADLGYLVKQDTLDKFDDKLNLAQGETQQELDTLTAKAEELGLDVATIIGEETSKVTQVTLLETAIAAEEARLAEVKKQEEAAKKEAEIATASSGSNSGGSGNSGSNNNGPSTPPPGCYYTYDEASAAKHN